MAKRARAAGSGAAAAGRPGRRASGQTKASIPAAPEVVLVPSRGAALCRWQDLPAEAKVALEQQSVGSEEQLAALPPRGLQQALALAPQFRIQLMGCWRSAACKAWRSRDRSIFADHASLRAVCAVLRTARTDGDVGTIGSVLSLPLPRGNSGDIAPLTALSALRSSARSGSDPSQICDAAIRQRIAASVRSSTAATYAGHLRSVGRFCNLLGVPSIPAAARTVTLYASVCSCAATLRGHIAAWHHAHLVVGAAWPPIPGDLWRAVNRGTAAIQAPRRPRAGARRGLVLALAQQAVIERSLRFCGGMRSSLCIPAACTERVARPAPLLQHTSFAWLGGSNRCPARTSTLPQEQAAGYHSRTCMHMPRGRGSQSSLSAPVAGVPPHGTER